MPIRNSLQALALAICSSWRGQYAPRPVRPPVRDRPGHRDVAPQHHMIAPKLATNISSHVAMGDGVEIEQLEIFSGGVGIFDVVES